MLVVTKEPLRKLSREYPSFPFSLGSVSIIRPNIHFKISLYWLLLIFSRFQATLFKKKELTESNNTDRSYLSVKTEWPCKAFVVQITNKSHKNMLIDIIFPYNIFTDVNEHGILTASLLKCYEEYYLGKELINRNTCSLFLLCGINGSCGLSYYPVIRMLY